MKTALFPGSFDPITNGHVDVIKRASKLFDELVVSVAVNTGKQSMFSIQERVDIIKEICTEYDFRNVKVQCFEGLIVNAVKEFDADVIVRGIRALSDFESEFQMALMNRELEKTCETIFLMPKPDYSFVSSRMIKEIAKFKGDISSFVPAIVTKKLSEKFE